MAVTPASPKSPACGSLGLRTPITLIGPADSGQPGWDNRSSPAAGISFATIWRPCTGSPPTPALLPAATADSDTRLQSLQQPSRYQLMKKRLTQPPSCSQTTGVPWLNQEISPHIGQRVSPMKLTGRGRAGPGRRPGQEGQQPQQPRFPKRPRRGALLQETSGQPRASSPAGQGTQAGPGQPRSSRPRRCDCRPARTRGSTQRQRAQPQRQSAGRGARPCPRHCTPASGWPQPLGVAEEIARQAQPRTPARSSRAVISWPDPAAPGGRAARRRDGVWSSWAAFLEALFLAMIFGFLWLLASPALPEPSPPGGGEETLPPRLHCPSSPMGGLGAGEVNPSGTRDLDG